MRRSEARKWEDGGRGRGIRRRRAGGQGRGMRRNKEG